MPNLYIEENWIDRTRNCGLGDSDIYESFTDNRGELYRAMQREYGRCVGKVRIDRTDGTTQEIGWVFRQRARYEDTREFYLRETWVTVHEAPPTKTIEYHYAS